MFEPSDLTDRRRVTLRVKRGLTRALAVSLLASVGVCGCGAAPAATAATKHLEKQISGPPAVVFIGDSISAYWSSGQGATEFTVHPNWIDKGVSGQTSTQVLARFQTDVIDLHPEIVHILVGTNDVYPDWTPASSEPDAIDSSANVEAMVRMAQANGIQVILATIPPWGCNMPNCSFATSLDSTLSRYDRINIWNAWIERYALSRAIPVVDYHSALLSPDGEHYVPEMTTDGVHPSAAGYVVMTPMVENVINAISSLYTNK